jgi:hypothetical protein
MRPIDIGQTTELNALLMGVGAIPSRVPTPHDVGHFWLYWTKSINHHQNEQIAEHRGYIFFVNQVPEYFRPIERWRDYLHDNSVPGAMCDEKEELSAEGHEGAVLTKIKYKSHCRDKNWPLTVRQKIILELRCWIPNGVHLLPEGYYSFATCAGSKDPNNCASWAIKMTNKIMDDDRFLPLPTPAKLSRVIKLIFDE